MFLVLRRGAVETLERAAVLGGAAAVACVRSFEIDPEWRERPGKVCLRARTAEHGRALERLHRPAPQHEEHPQRIPQRRRYAATAITRR